MDPLRRLRTLAGIRRGAVPGSCREHRKDHVLGIHHRQRSLLRSRDRARICLQRQPRLLQIHLPHNGLPETHEPLRRDACEMRRRKMRIMWKV